MGKVIAVLNQKGGVGKTTTAINLGAYLAKGGKLVLLVDFDPQGNATSGLGLDKQNVHTTTLEVLMGGAKLEKSVHETSTPGLFVLPANNSLATAEVDLVALEQRELKLKEALEGVAYDYILIDCPPSLGLLTVNALSAADYLFIPVQAEYYALEGLTQLLAVMQQVRGGLNPDLELLGVVVTMFDSRTSLSQQVYDELSKYFNEKLFRTIVPRNVRLAEAPSYGKTIAEYDKWSKGARAYKQLAKEFTKHVG